MKRPIAVLLIMAMTSLALPPKGWTLLAPAQASQTSVADASARSQDIKTIQKALESKILRQRLLEYGLTPEETNQRLSRLSDKQVHQLAKQSEKMTPAGDAGLGILVSLLVIGILVLLFVYLLRRV